MECVTMHRGKNYTAAYTVQCRQSLGTLINRGTKMNVTFDLEGSGRRIFGATRCDVSPEKAPYVGSLTFNVYPQSSRVRFFLKTIMWNTHIHAYHSRVKHSVQTTKPA